MVTIIQKKNYENQYCFFISVEHLVFKLCDLNIFLKTLVLIFIPYSPYLFNMLLF